MLVGWFGDIEEMAKPGKLERMRNLVGLDVIIPESSIWHTSGFRISPEVASQGPLEDWRNRPELAAYRKAHPRPDHVYVPFPGVLSGADDTQLLQIIEEAHRLGIKVWGHIGMWSYGASAYNEYLVETMFGKPLAKQWWEWGDPFCPSRREINDWGKACLIEVIQEYDIDGINYDHVRIAPPAALGALLGCACPSCQARAHGLGYDFDYMRSSMFAFLREMKNVSAARLEALAMSSLGMVGFLSLMGQFQGVLDWFNFRCDLLADEFKSYSDAAFSVAPEGFQFGSDVLPPSIAFLGGQIYTKWEEAATYLIGGGGGTRIGWGAAPLAACWVWAARLVRKLGQGKALTLMYRLFGLDEVSDLPGSLDALKAGFSVSRLLGEVRGLQFRKFKALTSGRRPCYVPVSLSVEIQDVAVQCDAIVENGLEGAILSGPMADEDRLRVVGSILKG